MKNKTIILVLTSIVCLLPVILGLAVYSDLPENVAMQWGFHGNPNWFAPKAAAVFGMPVFFALLNIIVITIINRDSRRKNVSEKMMAVVQWLAPVVSLVTVPIILFTAMGVELPVILIAFTLVGITFILIGNYLPKCKQNYSVGIRISWTLNDSENWNKTHRVGGLLWIMGGFMFIILAFLPFESPVMLILLFSILAVLIFAPLIYSYSLYKKGMKNSQKEVL